MIARRRTAVALLAALTVLFAFCAYGSGTKWITKRLGWDASAANGAGVTLPSGGKDTIIIIGAANPVDSNRTVQLTTTDFSWEEAIRSGYNVQSTLNSDSTVSVMLFTLTCAARTTGNRTDTVYVYPEYCYGGVCEHNDIAHTGATVATSIPLVADPNGKWGSGLAALSTPYTLNSPAQVVFQGYWRVDPNSPLAGNGYIKPAVRFNLIPGPGTGTLYNCRLSVTYPQRAQP